MPKKNNQEVEKAVKKGNELLGEYAELDRRIKAASETAAIDAITESEKKLRAKLLQVKQTLDGVKGDSASDVRTRIVEAIQAWDLENAEDLVGDMDEGIDGANDDTFGDDTVGVGSLNDLASMTSKKTGEWGNAKPAPASKPVNEWEQRKQKQQQQQQLEQQKKEQEKQAAAAPPPKQEQPPVQAPPAQQQQPSAKTSHAPSSSHSPAPAAASSESDLRALLEQLDMSVANLPHTLDVELQKAYEPPNAIDPIPYFPQEVHPVLASKEIYNQFDLETLCFIFYYHQKSYQQYFAAKALRENSYRYHTEEQRWLKRRTQPIESNEFMEKGSYTFFNFETWKEEQLDDFVFEYKYLEGDV